MTAHDWLQGLFQAIDARDADAFVAYLTEDAVLRFGNGPPVTGRAAVRDTVAAFFEAVAGVSHRLLDAWEVPDATICRGEVTYRRHDGRTLTVPFANIMKGSREAIREYVIYIDQSALFSPV